MFTHQGSGVTGVAVGGEVYVAAGVSIGIDPATRSIDCYLTPVTPSPTLAA